MPAEILAEMKDLKQIRMVIAGIILLLLLSGQPRAGFRPVNDAPVNTKAAEFELKDQHDKPFSYRFPKTRLTILIFGDRQGSEQIEGWVRPLYQRYQERVEQHGIAVLNTVPSLMRGVVRGIFKRNTPYPVLLDWKGDVARAYGYQSKKANLVLIDRQGFIAYRTVGPASESALQNLFAQVDRLLTEGGQ